MKTLFTILFVSMALMPAKLKVNYDYDKTADFGKFKTFAVATPSAEEMKAANEKYPTVVNQINEGYLTNAIISQMESKGYTQSDNPDLKVVYNIKIQTQTQYNATTTGMGPGLWGGGFYGGFYGYGGFGGMASTTVTPEDYNTGSLVIDVVSTETNKLVWYGGGSSVLSENSKKSEERINKNIAAIFDKYFWVAGQTEPASPIPGAKK
jgi:hypothetical protein